METEKPKARPQNLPGDKLVIVDGPHGGTLLTQHSMFTERESAKPLEEDTQPVEVVEEEEQPHSSHGRPWIDIVADKY